MKKILAALTFAAFTLTTVAVAQDKPKEQPKTTEKKKKEKKPKTTTDASKTAAPEKK